jgi:hypothetical protein
MVFEQIGESRSKEETVVCVRRRNSQLLFFGRSGSASTILRRNLNCLVLFKIEKNGLLPHLSAIFFPFCVQSPREGLLLFRGYKFLVLAPNAGARKHFFPNGCVSVPALPRSLVRDGQTSPHRPRLVVSRNKHTHSNTHTRLWSRGFPAPALRRTLESGFCSLRCHSRSTIRTVF